MALIGSNPLFRGEGEGGKVRFSPTFGIERADPASALTFGSRTAPNSCPVPFAEIHATLRGRSPIKETEAQEAGSIGGDPVK